MTIKLKGSTYIPAGAFSYNGRTWEPIEARALDTQGESHVLPGWWLEILGADTARPLAVQAAAKRKRHRVDAPYHLVHMDSGQRIGPDFAFREALLTYLQVHRMQGWARPVGELQADVDFIADFYQRIAQIPRHPTYTERQR